MSLASRAPRIFISVAEQSADEHAATLIRAFRERRPGATFHGLAGPAMRSAGCTCLRDMTAGSAMALAALRRVPAAWRLLRRLKRELTPGAFDAAVLLDSPALNLPIARLCRRRGLPVLYYIAPQTWAWGPRGWRNRRLRRRVDRLACLWPFEEPYFRAAGIPATCVGHPSIDRFLALRVDENRVRELRAGAEPVITLLPGSRAHVVDEVLPGQLEVAGALAGRFPRAGFLIVAANADIQRRIESHVAAAPLPRSGHAERVPILSGDADRAAAIRAADLALVASGTVTLEVACHGTPMIVLYNAGRWSWLLLGRWIVRTPYLSIPNILAGREIIPEFMPYYRSTEPIVARAVDWLRDPPTLARVRRDLLETVRPLLKPGAAERAAAELAALLDEPSP